MSSKRVRFAQDAGYTERTPSPTFSASSGSMSPGPLTPPTLQKDRFKSLSPEVAHKPLPKSVSIHPILGGKLAAQTNVDISLDPAITHIKSRLLTPLVLAEPATSPPLGELFLLSKYLPWKIQILPSTNSWVTVSDVLGGLYCALRLRVTAEEYNRTPSKEKPFVDAAFEQRCEKTKQISSSTAKAERQKGRRRIDFMMGNHSFQGLSPTDKPDEWKVSAV